MTTTSRWSVPAPESPNRIFVIGQRDFVDSSIVRGLQIYSRVKVIITRTRAGVQQPTFLGSSCIYPRACPRPIKEEYLLTGQLEPTNEPYARAGWQHWGGGRAPARGMALPLRIQPRRSSPTDIEQTGTP